MIEFDTTQTVTPILLFQQNLCHLCGEQDGDHKQDCPLIQQLSIELDFGLKAVREYLQVIYDNMHDPEAMNLITDQLEA